MLLHRANLQRLGEVFCVCAGDCFLTPHIFLGAGIQRNLCDNINSCNGIVINHEKRMRTCPLWKHGWGYYAKWNKADWESQIPYDFLYQWNLKKFSKQTSRRIWPINTENQRMVAGWGVGQNGWMKMADTGFYVWNK